MRTIGRLFFAVGVILVLVVGINKIFAQPYLLLGVRLLSLLVMANIAFSIAVLIKLHVMEKNG